MNNTYHTKFNALTEQFEIHLGNNVYMGFDKCPSYRIINRDTNKFNFNRVLTELTNNTQKILKKNMPLYTSNYRSNGQHKWFAKYYEEKKKEYTDEQMLTLASNADFNDDVNGECIKRHTRELNERYAGVMKTCPIKVEFYCEKIPKYYNPKDTKEVVITSYDTGYTYALSINRTMNLFEDCNEWVDKVKAITSTNKNSRDTYEFDIINKVIEICNNMTNYNFVNDTNFLGVHYNSKGNMKGSDSVYNGDRYINYIDIMYVRCGVGKTGYPLPNRMYKKESCELIDSPYSRQGTTKSLRQACGMNGVKRYTKMNKLELVKVLMKL
tara:strand:+ start:1409 stop:2383 length:975 start_codon:yes stop_codon:yes gene_type:complete